MYKIEIEEYILFRWKENYELLWIILSIISSQIDGKIWIHGPILSLPKRNLMLPNSEIFNKKLPFIR